MILLCSTLMCYAVLGSILIRNTVRMMLCAWVLIYPDLSTCRINGAMECGLINSRGVFQSSSVAQLCLTLCNHMDCSTPGLPVHHQLREFTQTHVYWISDAIQSFHPLSFLSPPARHIFQHQGLFKWVSSLHQVAKVLEFQLQHQSFQRTPRTDFL